MKRTVLTLALLTLATLAVAQERPTHGDGLRPRVPDTVRVDADIVYGRGGGRDLRLDLYRPRQTSGPIPVVVWIHGGGWRSGSKDRCKAVRMATRGFAVASVEYRLSSEAAFPAQIHDVKAAVRWVRANAGKYGFDPEHIGAWGSSAGGHLAALLGTTAGVEALEGSGGNPDLSSSVQAVCDWYGPTDLTVVGELSGHGDGVNPIAELLGGPVSEKGDLARLASPVTHVHAGAPPFLVLHGSEDKLVPVEQSRLLVRALEKAGVPVRLHLVEGGGHGFRNAEVDRIVNEFLDIHLNGEKPLELIEDSFRSSAGKAEERFLVYLPPGYATSELRYPVIYWLHGRGGSPRGGDPFLRLVDASIRKGSMPATIVVFPSGRVASLYCDSRDGTSPVETIIAKELIPHVDATYRTRATRDSRAIEGFSMGGFGAAHLGFKYPEIFGAVTIVSGGLFEPSTYARLRPEAFARVFGRDPDYMRAENPFTLIEKNADGIRGRTKTRLMVGMNDSLKEQSFAFHRRLDELSIPHGLIAVPGAGHAHEKIYEETEALSAEFYREAFGRE